MLALYMLQSFFFIPIIQHFFEKGVYRSKYHSEIKNLSSAEIHNFIGYFFFLTFTIKYNCQWLKVEENKRDV